MLDLLGVHYTLSGHIDVRSLNNLKKAINLIAFFYLYQQIKELKNKSKMKYIVGVFFSMLIFGLVACGNEGGDSPVISRQKTSYLDLNVYKGSEKNGATIINYDTVPGLEKDSLFRILSITKFFPKVRSEIENDNRISFEFLDGDKLSFSDLSNGLRIISSYVYKDDSLFVLQGGTEREFVAVRELDGSGFYRTKAVKRRMLKKEMISADSTAVHKGGLITFEGTLEFAGFDDGKDMINPMDTIAWCNVKYIYK